MKKVLKSLRFALLIIIVTMMSGKVHAQIMSAVSGNWSNPSTWVGGVVPVSTNDVIIAAGHTVAIDNATASCNNLSFGDPTARLDMNNPTGVFSVYGNFTIASTTHAVFTSWAAGAKIKFTGSAASQIISGFPANNTPPFSFAEMIVDKPVGTIVTTGGNGMRIGLTTSLEIISGSFELAASDDIEGRNLTGTTVGGPFAPSITVQAAGTFRMASVNSHIRSGANTGDNDAKIGKLTTYGFTSLTSGQANRINFNNVDVMGGGTLELRPSGSVAGTLNPGTVTVMSGGLVKQSFNNIAGNNWFTNVTTPTNLVIQAGGELELNTDKTDYLPQLISLLPGSYVRYSTIAAQNLSSRTEMAAYSNLILQATAKTVTQNISVSDTLFMRTSSTAAPSIALGAFTLTYGSNATLQYRGIGAPAPVQTTANTEFPNSGSVPKNLSIYNSSTVVLNATKTIAGNLSFEGIDSKLVLGANSITANAVINYTTTKYCITDGAGSLGIRNIGVTPVDFPIGISALSYQPVTITNNGVTDNFTARVAAGTPCGIVPADAVNAVWTLTEAVPGGSSSNIKMQWNTADENANFNRNYCFGIACTGATVTNTGTGAAAGGTGPYTRQLNNVTVFDMIGISSSAAPTIDMSATALVTPVSGGCKSATETVTVTIQNNSSSSINFNSNNVTVTATATGGYNSNTILNTGTLAAGATQNVVMPATIDMSAGGSFTFNAATSVAGDANTGNDAMTAAIVTATAAPSATINYGGSPYCSSLAVAQSVTVTGTTGGTFASTTGLSINAATGAITPSTSTPGTYTVTYTITAGGGCPQFTTTASVTITQAPAASIFYSTTPFCTNQGQAVPTFGGTTGGTYSASPAGLSIDPSTGIVTLGTSAPGLYIVTYSLAAANGCAAVATTAGIDVRAMEDAGFNYGGTTTFCKTGTNPNAVVTGTPGGTFSATPAGLVFANINGTINLAASTVGTYTVSYFTPGSFCNASSSITVSVVASPSAIFSYASSGYCTNAANPAPVYGTGASAGIFSAIPAGLSINSSTGVINPAASTAGTYTVTNFIAASGGCSSATAITTVTITQLPSAVISYSSPSFCNSVATAQPVTVTGTAGGSFSASPAGLTINVTTGAITPSTSTLGTYTVTYTIAAGGGCGAVTATATVNINAAPTATISYAGSPYCSNSSTAAVTLVGTTGGTFSSTTGLSINTTTGAIIPSASTPGTYTVTYTIPAQGGCNQVLSTATVIITPLPAAVISYPGSPFCKSLPTAQPVILTGTTGGAFSSTAGLTINAATGAVTPSSSVAGTYTVTYTIPAANGCGVVTATAAVTITAVSTATVSYAGSPFCSNVSSAQAVTVTGTAGGTFSAAPAGLIISATTGAITPSTSTAGTYIVTYTIPAQGGCTAVPVTTTVTVTSAPAATITYGTGPFCAGTGLINVSQTGTTGGVYAATGGLPINASTGAINLATAAAGTYTVTYTVAAAGGCAVVTTTTTVIVSAASVVPTAAVVSKTTSCGATTVNLSLTGGSLATGASWKWYSGSCGGTLVGTGAVVNNVTVNATTTFYVRAEGGTCGNSSCASVTVTVFQVPAVTLTADITDLLPLQKATLTATAVPAAGSTYTWLKNGVISATTTANTFAVNIDSIGQYTVRVTTTDGCAVTSSAANITAKYSDKLWISPNPANGPVVIRYYNDRPVAVGRRILIFDSWGRRVYNKDVTVNAGSYTSMNVSLTGLSKGLYFVSVLRSDGAELVNGKLLLQ